VSAPRVAAGSRRDLGLPLWVVARVTGLATGVDGPNLFLTIGRHRRLFRGWLSFAGRLMPGGRLPRRETELAILRVARLRGCEYEHQHHLRLARRAGVSPAEVERIGDTTSAFGWSAREQAIVSATDALVGDRDLDDSEWAALRSHLDDTEVIELCFLVGHYDMLATVIQALRIQPDLPRGRRTAGFWERSGLGPVHR
jgi:AhpD family alkylhydroperoxidase